MRILDSSSNLFDYLSRIKEKRVSIISAFASGTERLVLEMVDKGNTVELVVGTINAFTSPDFIDFCAKQKSPALAAHIDFRYHLSTHWKLYLISPDIVLIGSANFTDLGVSLQRDTCVEIRDDSLYRKYHREFARLRSRPEVLRAGSGPRFQQALAEYKLAHQRTQAGITRSGKFSTLQDWLADETNQAIPLFVWTVRHTDKERDQAQQLHLRSAEGEPPILRDFFTYQAPKNDLPYSEGDMVLCCGAKGGQMAFHVFDKIIYKSGKHFIYSYRKQGLKPPFDLRSIKEKLKQIVAGYQDDKPTLLSRATLANIAAPSSVP